jgi:two-component system phosphate regulon response regulator PhoB
MSKILQPSILVVEDESAISSIVKYNLKKEGFNVEVIEDGAEALDFINKNKPDLILLDWMLPSLSGIDICKSVRSNTDTSNIPIIMLTAKSEEANKLSGLERGADDYITKPFSPAELIARIKAILRRIRPAFSGKIVSFEDIVIDTQAHMVTRNNKELNLSPIEFKILQVLIENPGKVFSRDALMDKIWGSEVYVGARTIDVHITRLRKILLEASTDEYDVIKTIRLAGYTIRSRKK